MQAMRNEQATKRFARRVERDEIRRATRMAARPFRIDRPQHSAAWHFTNAVFAFFVVFFVAFVSGGGPAASAAFRPCPRVIGIEGVA